ncbi:hypothetical protein PAEPH01_2548 [Pancytospora epiphaga]|nr:hypothetical protein PAEPH01_2548 [Pancytospora epiphaga]
MDLKDLKNSILNTVKVKLYEYTKCPLDYPRHWRVFQKAMNNILAKKRKQFLQVHLDNVIVYSKSKKKYKSYLKRGLIKPRPLRFNFYKFVLIKCHKSFCVYPCFFCLNFKLFFCFCLYNAYLFMLLMTLI